MTALDYQQDLYYRHTGKAPFAGTTLGAIVSWAAVTALAGAYAYADLYIKVYDIISFLILGVFCFVAGFVVYAILKWAQVRNTAVVGVIALSSALLALYASWVIWEYALIAQAGHQASMSMLFRRPDIVWRIAKGINAEGTFSMHEKMVTGGELWLAWAIEAAAIVGTITLMPVKLLKNMAFCENCRKWCKENVVLRVKHGDESVLRDHMESKDLGYLLLLGKADSETPLHLRVDLHNCPTCSDTHLMTVRRVAVSYNNKNQRQESAKKIIDRMWLDSGQAAQVRSFAAPTVATPAQRTDATAAGEVTESTSSGVDSATPPAVDSAIGLGKLASIDKRETKD